MRFGWLTEPPFNFRTVDGGLTGCDVELARHVLQALGETLEPVETEFASLLPGLATDRWRMTTGMFVTAERARLAGFTRTIWRLADGLLVAAGNPLRLTGYVGLAQAAAGQLAVVRGQVQHDTAARLGLTADRIEVFDSYAAAAVSVADGRCAAFASVARAHRAFLAASGWELTVVEIPAGEAAPAAGAFALASGDPLLSGVDAVLAGYLGSGAHRAMLARFGFSEAETALSAAPD